MISSSLFDHQPFKKAKGISKISLGNVMQILPEEMLLGIDKNKTPDPLVRAESKRVSNILPRNRFPESNQICSKPRDRRGGKASTGPEARLLDPYGSVKRSVTEERRMSSQTPVIERNNDLYPTQLQHMKGVLEEMNPIKHSGRA